MRGKVKRVVERALVHSGLVGMLSLRQRTERLVLAYHNVVPDAERPWGERALHLSATRFREQLQTLSDVAEIVPLEVILQQPGHASGKPRVAITFDDGYRGAVTVGARELRRLGVPATFFVTPGMSSKEGFWWDRLASGPEGGTLDGELRSYCLGTLRGRQGEILEWARGQGMSLPAAPEMCQGASEEELAALLTSELFEIQSHTWSHPNLVRLDETERRQEFRRAAEWITQRCGRTPMVVSYPYGLESPGVQEDAKSSGYRWGLRITGGWLPREALSPFALPRLNVPSGLSPEGLRLRLAGIGVA